MKVLLAQYILAVMKQEWPEIKNGRATGRMLSGDVPAELYEIVRAIGFEFTAKLLLTYGGAAIYVPRDRVTARSNLTGLIGEDAAMKLGGEIGGTSLKVPTGNKFLARYLCSKGAGKNEIARTIRVSVVTVNVLLKEDRKNSSTSHADALEKSADKLKASADRVRKRERLKHSIAQASNASGKQPK